ncbi:dihydrodipicolinate synthetase [Beutenbergia cavernae DSM 12333]|uniref:Dihydrodipicolinate synthetase n=1 Tax=Beutenbergia cavernae (strain ATCC BAA-8 / DSM 12333 / CCUG 43141 / JCM 11478 / NBRC 16432 / NCIMB 13614 / HKI 0122) TaxID=471853 RepID=C5C262_BEUC1|nr:dihydrodipicolinate synthase family protein [Beutenbergia cavernae]ACQ81687.1 dihydrodipicolinate synthetase [Beutenbergia cavernae DSM 12333]
MTDGTRLLGGVTVPLVTPMDPGGRPSAEASGDLLVALADVGVQKLMLLGSNGEGPLLPTSTIAPFVDGAVDRWRSSVADGVVTVNVTAAGTLEALERAEIAASAGADALVMSPPIYFHHRADEIVAHYAALGAVGLPVIAYNAPRYSNPLTREILEALLDLEHVVGLKDSSGDLELFADAVAIGHRRPGFAVSQGAETQLAAGLAAGADGVVPGVANIAPRVSLELVAAHAAGDAAAVDRLQDVTTALTALHAIRRGTPGVKAVLSVLGLCPPHVAPPLLASVPAESEAFQQFVVTHSDQLHPMKG